MKNVAGKVALITGGALGMGKKLGEHFLRDGAKLVVWDMRDDELQKTVEEHKKISPNVFGYKIDLTEEGKIAELAKQVEKDVGPVSILVNNAGIVAGGLFLDVPMEKHKKEFDVNVIALIQCMHTFLPGMIERGEGHIVNMASAAGLMGAPGMSSYCGTKFAVVGFSESMRLELRKMGVKNVKITIVCPSYVTTGMFEGFKELPISAPMTPQKMADSIYDGMKKDKVYVKEPFIIKLIPITKALSHPIVFEWMAEKSGIMDVMDNYTGREKSIPGKTS